jgi:Xaa-Pro aminopeptidase
MRANGIYDNDRLTPPFHKNRRDSVLAKMAPHSAALFLAAPEKNRANDVNYEYHQDPNFYYLTGHTQPHAALLLVKGTNGNKGGTTEFFFVENKDPKREVWTGKMLGVEGAEQVLGFDKVFLIDSLASMLSGILASVDTLYYAPTYLKEKDYSLDTSFNLSNDVIHAFGAKFPKLAVVSPRAMLAELRMKKTALELGLMRRVIQTTCEGHNQILKSAKPGWHEYDIQALGEYVFKRMGCEYTGYPCIVGSGNNSTILHYETNRRKTEPGDFIEMDIGAEYHGYSADVTRSFPINGKFSPEQRAIYDLVLEAQDSGIAAAKKGNSFRAPHYAAVRVITAGLLRLGIIKDSAEYKTYFMHGTSHYLGLDVHDAGNFGPLAPNEVITVEPGIYIADGSPCDKKWWKIGCRIEDDILITEDGNEILSRFSPRTADEVEAMMNSK